MCVIRALFVVFLVHSALSEESLLHPCKKDDIACLTNAAQNFLEKTSAGVPAYDIKPIDPMPLTHIEINLASGKKVHLKNVNVTGLKKLIIHDFKIDTDKRDVLLAMENYPEIVADIEVESEDSKLSGTLSASGKVIPTARYNYDLVPNDKGVEYFTVGPETLTCVLEGTPKITVSDEIGKVLLNDDKAEESKVEMMCSMVLPAFRIVMHNLRASAKIFPKTAYFTDL